MSARLAKRRVKQHWAARAALARANHAAKRTAPPPMRVVVAMPIEEARRLSLGIADLLCWAAGFRAARPDDYDNHPMGIHRVRDLRDHLERAIERADPARAAQDLPF